MATAIRIFVVLAILAVTGGVGMWVLANFVEPKQREIVVPIPVERLIP